MIRNMKRTSHTELSPLASALPDRLNQAAADAVREVIAEGTAANTVRAYAAALRYWEAWHQLRYGIELSFPVSESCVVQFLVDHLQRTNSRGQLTSELPQEVDRQLRAQGFKGKAGPLSLATVDHRVSVLSKAHVLKGVENPCALPSIRALLSSARRASVKRGERPHKKTAATGDVLRALLDTCDESLIGLRDRALLLFGFASGGRRRSEIALADLRDLRRVPEGFIYRLEYSKTRQAGAIAGSQPDKPILGEAAEALERWLRASMIGEGRIFRSVRGTRLGESLSDRSVAEIVKRRALMAGVSGDFAGHSLRSGFATEAGNQGVPLSQTMAMSDHRSVPTLLGYVQTGEVTSNPAARLLNPAPKAR